MALSGQKPVRPSVCDWAHALLSRNGAVDSWPQRLCIIALLVGLWAVGIAVVLGATPFYTSVRIKDCVRPEQSVMTAYQRRGQAVQECQAPAGLRLFVVSTDAHSWLAVAHEGSVWSTEDEVVYNSRFGNFPNVGGADVIEWRLGTDRTPYALIFRVTAQDSGQPSSALGRANVSRLFVLGIAPERICFRGIAESNILARQMADTPTPCLRPLPHQLGP